MSESPFERLSQLYNNAFMMHGDSPSALLTPKGRQALRYRAIDPFMECVGTRILDYGCGLGYLLDYLSIHFTNFNYYGVDFVDSFIQQCKAKHGSSEFSTINPADPIKGDYDIVFASGVFNISTHSDELSSRLYTYSRLQELFSLASNVLICDFPSSNVDFRLPEAQHFSPMEISKFCMESLSRRFLIRHDLLPYEFTLIAFKDDSIKRPENLYNSDL
jgi:hypothetical protein